MEATREMNDCSSSLGVVAVTGAGGYIASWLVKTLLLKGHHVRGTARNPDDPKNSHLRELEGAKERLTLHKADLLEDESSLYAVFSGCHGLFHVASPITNDPARVRDAVEGTRNAIRTAAAAGIRRVVFTSSIGAVHMNPSRSPDAVLDESCWSDPQFCKNTKNWYCYAKMMAELAATEEAQALELKLLVVVPPATVGPTLQMTATTASLFRMLEYMRGRMKAYKNAVQGYIDVRDVAKAHVAVYQNADASGRYLCIESVIHRSQFCRMLREMFPEYPVTNRPIRCEDEVNPMVKPYKFSNRRLRDLGVEFTPIRQSLYETVKCLQERGHLTLPSPRMARYASSL